MSRCFPFPPPGYVKNGIRDEALIESIKIKREEEKAKKETKKEKKEKKEKKDKKREKKEKEKVRDSGETESKKLGHKKRHKDERNQEDQKGGDHQKRREKDVECFGKNTLNGKEKVRDSGETESKKPGHKKRHKDERNQEDQKGGDHQKRREKEVECFEKSMFTEKEKVRDSGEIESKKLGHKKRHKDERNQEDQKGGDHQKRREKEVECFEKSMLTEKEKARDSGETESKKLGHKKRHKDERNQEDKKGGDHQKRREKEVECFEKSTLTEEHGQAVAPQTDSTLNSSKRQKLSSPPDNGHDSGSIIRMRLPSQRHKDPEVLPNKEQPCSTSGKNEEAFIQGVHEYAPRPGRELEEYPCSTSNGRRLELTFKLSKEKSCSSSGASDSLAHNAEASLLSNLCTSCPPTLALEFKNLVEDWVVPTLQSEAGFGDDDWLFPKKKNLNSGVKSSKDGNVGISQFDSTTWPRAFFLPEADIYALPFTVPF